MASASQSSLFDGRSEASIITTLDQVETLFLGEFATVIAVVAIALVGFLMLSGRLNFLRSLRVFVGCCLLFGASAMASFFMNIGGKHSTEVQVAMEADNAQPRRDLPQSVDSPYSRAAVTNNR